MPPEEDQATAAGNMHKNVIPEISTQSNRPTDMIVTILSTPTRKE